MALSNLEIFQEQVYSTSMETLAQQVDLFNTATNGAIVLRSGSNQGDYNEQTFWKRISGLIRRRDAYGSGAVSAVNLNQGLNVGVKVAGGTPPVEIDPGAMEWINRSPDEYGVVIGEQLAEGQLQDMLNVGLAAMRYANANTGATVEYDGTAGTATLTTLNSAAALFGDRAQSIAAWVMHSKVMHDIYATALANSERLFQFGNVQVMSDGFGRPLIMTDSADLLDTVADPDEYYSLGLVGGGLIIEQNDDFTSNIETNNGDENIARTYQAEWSYNLNLKGYAWDKTNGGKSPTDAELRTGSNWDKVVTSVKDTAGVTLKTQ